MAKRTKNPVSLKLWQKGNSLLDATFSLERKKENLRSDLQEFCEFNIMLNHLSGVGYVVVCEFGFVDSLDFVREIYDKKTVTKQAFKEMKSFANLSESHDY